MKISIVSLVLASFLQFPFSQSHDSIACKRSVEIIESSPAIQCLITSKNETDCIDLLTKDNNVLNTYELHRELLTTMKLCKDDIMQNNTKELRDRLVKRRVEEKEKCSKKNLNVDDAYFCQQSEKDIQDLNQRLQKKQSKKRDL